VFPILSWLRCRRRAVPLFLILAGSALAAGPAAAQDFSKYHDYAELTGALKSLVDGHKNLARLGSVGKTPGGRDVWVVEIANPAGVPLKDRPGLLVAANFEGDHLIGSEIALFVIADLLRKYPADAEVKACLDGSVIYVVPRVNPDGAEGMFAGVKTGGRTNGVSRDDDNDGRLDEDGPEDLNKDGFITVMRLKAPDGEYTIDPAEARLMKRADPKKGESGTYRLYWEGIDNDGDGFINEDPAGGTDLNRNFTHEYEYYSPDAGPHMISEKETRGLMDWVLGHRNIAAFLTFGESDNLIVPPTSAGRLGSPREIDLVRFAEASVAAARSTGMIQTGGFGFGRRGMGMFSIEMFMGGRQRAGGTATQPSARAQMPARQPVTTVNAADADYFRTVSGKYTQLTGIRQPLYVREPKGAFFQYGYFQFGVPSFSTPGFGLSEAAGPGRGRMGTAPPAGGEQAAAPARQETRAVMGEAMAMMMGGGAQQFMIRQAGGAGARTAASAAQPSAPGIDAQVLKWMAGEKIDGFVDWTKFNHPVLGEVEIGGFKPYAVTNPPAARIAELGASHSKFVAYLPTLFPKVGVAKTEVTNHGGGLFRIKAEVENTGFLPTALAQGVTARAVRPIMVQLGVKPEAIVSGSAKINFIQTLDGSGGRAKYEWIIRGKTGDTIELLVSSQKAGSETARITLK
jgi:hypothetical protein